jgi:glycosidase
MTNILLFWAAKGIDGFRCDMAEMVPAEFWAWATKQVKEKYPELVFIGEVYNPNEYRHYIASGFDYLYDKVGMYDTMFQIIRGQQSTQAITGAWQAVDDIRDHMLYFLENHDELRIASDFFAANGRKAVPALVVNALMQQNPFMLYAGQEYGERGMDCEGFSGHDGRTTIFDYWTVGTLCRAAAKKLTDEEQQLYEVYHKVLNIARKEKAVSEGESYDLMYVNQRYHRQYMFLRKAKSSLLLVVANFDDAPAVVDVLIPAHAFEFLGLREKSYLATDLLGGDSMTLALKKDQTVHVEVAARGAVVLKMK